MQKYTKNIVVCINHFYKDTEKEIAYVLDYVKKMGCLVEISDAYQLGGAGSINLARAIVSLCDKEIDYKPLYSYDLSIIDKIKTICREIYRADDVTFSDKALQKIAFCNKYHFDKLPVCIAKTQYSLTDNPKILGSPRNFTMHVSDIRLSAGAGFIVVLMGNIMTMPGLSKSPSYLKMKIHANGRIEGLF